MKIKKKRPGMAHLKKKNFGLSGQVSLAAMLVSSSARSNEDRGC